MGPTETAKHEVGSADAVRTGELEGNDVEGTVVTAALILAFKDASREPNEADTAAWTELLTMV